MSQVHLRLFSTCRRAHVLVYREIGQGPIKHVGRPRGRHRPDFSVRKRFLGTDVDGVVFRASSLSNGRLGTAIVPYGGDLLGGRDGEHGQNERTGQHAKHFDLWRWMINRVWRAPLQSYVFERFESLVVWYFRRRADRKTTTSRGPIVHCVVVIAFVGGGPWKQTGIRTSDYFDFAWFSSAGRRCDAFRGLGLRKKKKALF